MNVKLKTAFNILRPHAPTYAALNDAHEAFNKTYGDNVDLLEVGQAARECLVEKDVYWFCDYDRYSREVSSETSIVVEIQHRLEELHQMDGLTIEVRGSWIWVSALEQAEDHVDRLKVLGFEWRERKKRWAWCPSALN